MLFEHIIYLVKQIVGLTDVKAELYRYFNCNLFDLEIVRVFGLEMLWGTRSHLFGLIEDSLYAFHYELLHILFHVCLPAVFSVR